VICGLIVLLASVQIFFNHEQLTRADKFTDQIVAEEASFESLGGGKHNVPNQIGNDSILFSEGGKYFEYTRFYWNRFKKTLSEENIFPLALYGLAMGWWLLEWRIGRKKSISN
jgi:hypothetical protein